MKDLRDLEEFDESRCKTDFPGQVAGKKGECTSRARGGGRGLNLLKECYMITSQSAS